LSKPVFFDPQRKRWKRIRRTADVLGLLLSLLVVFFVITVVRGTSIPSILLADQKKNYRALKEKEVRHPKRVGTHRKTKIPPSQVTLNSGEGIRGAFYVMWDPASFSSMREYVHQIDFVFPEWLHVLSADGHLEGVTELNTMYPVINNGKVAQVDPKLMPFLKQENAETEVFPLVNNFDPISNLWREDIGPFLESAQGRARFRSELLLFLAQDRYKGLTLDIEGFPEEAQHGYRALVQELSSDLHSRGLKLYVSVPVANHDFDYGFMAKHVDGLIMMNYDEHYPGGAPGAVASQEWFTQNLVKALKDIPREKIICAIGNYGYDWTSIKGQKPGQGGVHNVSVQEAWIEARDAESDINFDSDLLNPHFTYLDEKNNRHDVWYLDAATALNQMRTARALGITTFALWRLGSEDRTLWSIWDAPSEANAHDKLRDVPPGQDTDMEGAGEIIRIESDPVHGRRDITLDTATNLITDEAFESLPMPYRLALYGEVGKKVALTFDDGPDPEWTPKILDELKKANVKATFFVIGLNAEKYSGITRRIFNEGHELGNHTFTHPDISGISRRYMQVELNLTERLFAGRLGVKPVLFRPPYSVDQEPDTADEVRPLEVSQSMGYITVGNKIDPNDWRDNPKLSAEQVAQAVVDQLPKGNIVLLHDGGGNRDHTVKAIPIIVRELRARGYQIVPVSELLGKSYADVMPPISKNERFSARVDAAGFMIFGAVNAFIVFVFFVGDVLMSGRLVLVGTLAIYDRLRRRTANASDNPDYKPRVAVLVPAFNEEMVIERTVRSVLDSDYPNLRVIVIDDGSSDRTYEVACNTFAEQIKAGHVLVLRQENGGKARALNYGLTFVDEEIYVGIDADTIIAREAITHLVPHFINPKVGAMAGNAKVGNRVNLWTRWQALEYITSQNFERRALNALATVSVVPGAIGAWRTSAVKEAGGYKHDTVAEDADLTMALLQHGYNVEYEDRSLAYTEAPTTANGLMRQRFRWSFGILQATYKHKSAFKRGSTLGWVALPNIVIFQILLPLVSPFIDVMFVVGALKYLVWDKHFHPDTADPASFQQLVLFFALFMVIDFVASTIAFALERRDSADNRDWWLLGHVWLQRFAYRQLFSYVLFRTLFRAAEGGHFSWDKLDRTATVKAPAAKPRETVLDGEPVERK
jgi:cellulose synthase/poly-beta-1,6-N-acetylglucosamine synthase-like glycosyltransferase/peptidoglycan/xylan/chitin deacetylase (PgdA/CDA1 family)/spore germination protein YaaH